MPAGWSALDVQRKRLAALAVLVLAGWAFGSLAEGVVEAEPIVTLDTRLAAWLHAHASHGLTQFMLLVTHLHSTLAISIYFVVMAAWLAWRRAWYWLCLLALVLPPGMVFNDLLKHAFQRSRPTFDDPLLVLGTYSFPSGHTAAATLFYGVVVSMLVARTASSRRTAAYIGAGAGMVLLVALSRMYLGAHYLSDVLAAASWSLCWLVICLLGATAVRERHTLRKVHP
jgi:undecaprenyl-diphosphatase